MSYLSSLSDEEIPELADKITREILEAIPGIDEDDYRVSPVDEDSDGRPTITFSIDDDGDWQFGRQDGATWCENILQTEEEIYANVQATLAFIIENLEEEEDEEDEEEDEEDD